MILILTTTDKKSLAHKIGKSLLKQKLIACYSILPQMESSYWWFTPPKTQRKPSTNSSVKANAKIEPGKGKIVNAKEFQLVLKTKAKNFEKIEKVIKKLHTYDLPEIISININKAGKDYLTWIASEIS